MNRNLRLQPAEIRHVVTVVPAHNEERCVAASIESVIAAMKHLPEGTTGEIVVTADRCRDGTVALAREALGSSGTVVTLDAGNVGAARRLGVTDALSRNGEFDRTTWIASTDADTVVPPNWLQLQLEAAAAGYCGVAGVVELRQSSQLRLPFSVAYLDDNGVAPAAHRPASHRHVHGANMGFSAGTYLRVGGWRHLRTGEDHDLWNRLKVAGAVISTTALHVRTSDRLVARAPMGFAADLRVLADTSIGVSGTPQRGELAGAIGS